MTRGRDEIDSELRLLAAVRRTVLEDGGPAPDIAAVDELLDERQLSQQRDADNEEYEDAGRSDGST